MTSRIFAGASGKEDCNMWRFFVFTLAFQPSIWAQKGAVAFASPIYELATYSQQMAQLSEGTIEAIRVSGGTFDADRIYICLKNPVKSGVIFLSRFQAIDGGGPYMTPVLYKLTEKRSITVSAQFSLELIALFNELAVVESIRRGGNEDARKFITVGYSNLGGIEYADSQLRRFLPLVERLCSGLQWSRSDEDFEISLRKDWPR